MRFGRFAAAGRKIVPACASVAPPTAAKKPPWPTPTRSWQRCSMAMAPATPTAAGSSSSPHPDDPGRMLSQEAVMPDGMAAFSSGVHDRLDVVEIGAADAVDAPFAQVDAPRAVAMMFQSDDPFAADHLRAVDAHELVGVHARFQRFDRMVDQPAAAADVQAHIVALSLDQVDLARVDAQQIAAVSIGRAHV